MDQRAVFFLGAGVVCFLITLVTPSEFQWLSIGLGVVYVLLSLGSWLDDRSRRSAQR